MEWNEGLPAEIKDHPCMANFKSVEDVCKSWVGAQPMIGVDKIPVPKGDDDANWPTIYNRLGRPEKSEGYKMGEIKDLPEGFTVGEENVKNYLTKAHELGLSQRQAAALFEFHVGQRSGEYSAGVKKINETTDANSKLLRTQYGAAYEANVALANKTLQHFSGDDSKELAAALGSNPKFIKMMAKIGNDYSEDVIGSGAPKPGDMTPQVAHKEAMDMLSDSNSALNKASHPEHKVAVERYTQLLELANPGEVDD